MVSTSAEGHETAPVGHRSTDRRDLVRWQNRLLPFMVASLAVLATLFFALSVYDSYQMRGYLSTEVGEPSASPTQYEAAATVPLQVSLLRLESQAMHHRYRQASALLMSRIWTRQLAFMTGMVLALIGAVFILGKLSEGSTSVDLGAHGWKAALSSSSPGLVLAFLGVVLMSIALVVQPRIEVEDRPVYFATLMAVPKFNVTPAQTTPATDPGALDPGLGPTVSPPKPKALEKGETP